MRSWQETPWLLQRQSLLSAPPEMILPSLRCATQTTQSAWPWRLEYSVRVPAAKQNAQEGRGRRQKGESLGARASLGRGF